MVYIFTEAVRCGEIGKQAIHSFHKHHNHTLHVYVGVEDLPYIDKHPNTVIHVLESDNDIYQSFDKGHLGTSKLWTSVIKNTDEGRIIHFDSDVFFRDSLVDDIIEDMKENDLVGSFRPYKCNPNNRDDVRMYPDVVQTYCFGFNKSKITITDENILQKMVQGFYWKHPVIDFFDPVSFHIIENGGRVKIIDNRVIGGVDSAGGRMNTYEENKIFDFGDKIIHFAGVGSGKNFYKMIVNNQQINVPRSYIDFGLKRYNIYSQIFFGKSICNVEPYAIETIQSYVSEPPNILYINLKERIDRKTLMEEQLKPFNFTRIDGIYDKKGLIGCVKSHIFCIEYAKQKNFPYVIIFEDDLEWTTPIQYVKKVFNTLSFMNFDVAVLCPVFSKTNDYNRINDYFIGNCETQTTLGYVCKNHYYDTLLDNFKESCKLLEKENIDDVYALDQYWKKLQTKDNWMFAYPILGKQRKGFSNILNKNVNYDSAYNRKI